MKINAIVKKSDEIAKIARTLQADVFNWKGELLVDSESAKLLILSMKSSVSELDQMLKEN